MFTASFPNFIFESTNSKLAICRITVNVFTELNHLVKLLHTIYRVTICVRIHTRKIMATNLSIDNDLLQQALDIGEQKTKKDTVNLALKEFIERRKQQEVIELFGVMEPDADYDYKKARDK